jgi:hypothetical protein
MSTYNRKLAEAVILLYNKGNFDPSCDEILSEFLGVEDLPKLYRIDLFDRLKEIQKIVRDDSGLQTCLVSRYYYQVHRGDPPITEAAARKCLPRGRGARPHGIKFANGKDDLIFQIAAGTHLATASNSLLSGVQKIVKANQRGYIPDNKAGRLIKDAHQISIPKAALKLEEKAG